MPARLTLPMLRVRAEPDGALIPLTSLALWQREVKRGGPMSYVTRGHGGE